MNCNCETKNIIEYVQSEWCNGTGQMRNPNACPTCGTHFNPYISAYVPVPVPHWEGGGNLEQCRCCGGTGKLKNEK